MKSISWLCLLAGAVPVFSSVLKPIVAHEVRSVDVAEERHIDIRSLSRIEGRNLNLGTIDFAKTFPTKDVLFNIALGKSKGAVSAQLYASVTCISCVTTGKAVVTTEGVSGSLAKSIGSEIGDFFHHPTDIGTITTDMIVDAFDLNIDVDLQGIGGHFEFDISFGGSGTYTVTLYKSETPFGIQLNDDDKIGLLLNLELSFTVSAAVDFTTGFDLVFPKGANFVFNPLNGKLVSHDSSGITATPIPVKLVKGNACITALLRLKFQVGVALSVLGKGFDFEAGVFFDPIQYKACVTYDPKAACEIAFTEQLSEEIGAYARGVVDLDFAKFSAGPTAVTTYYTLPLPSKCISSHASTPTTKQLSHTTAQADHDTTKKTVVSKTLPHATTKHTGEATTKKVTSAHDTSKHVPSGSHPASHSTGKASGSVHPSGVAHSSGSHPASHSSGQKSASGRPSGSHSLTLTRSAKPTSIPHSRYSNSTSKAVGGTPWTTSTITTTSVYTITSCKPEVTDCPGRIGQVTSEVIITTTVCPVSGAQPTQGAPGPAQSQVGSGPASSEVGSGHVPSGVKVAPPSITGTPAGSDLTTRTISTTSTYTVISCQAQVVHCPASLQTPIVQTKTVVQYTTVCPVSQTDFPTVAPSATATAVASVSVIKSIVIVSPIPLSALTTPLVQTLPTFVPPYATFTYSGLYTDKVPYPSKNGTKSIGRPTAPVSRLPVKHSSVHATGVKPTGVKPTGVKPSLSHLGGPVPTSEIKNIKAQAESTAAASPSASPFLQASGASSGNVGGLLPMVAAGFVGVVAMLML